MQDITTVLQILTEYRCGI